MLSIYFIKTSNYKDVFWYWNILYKPWYHISELSKANIPCVYKDTRTNNSDKLWYYKYQQQSTIDVNQEKIRFIIIYSVYYITSFLLETQANHLWCAYTTTYDNPLYDYINTTRMLFLDVELIQTWWYDQHYTPVR